MKRSYLALAPILIFLAQGASAVTVPITYTLTGQVQLSSFPATSVSGQWTLNLNWFFNNVPKLLGIFLPLPIWWFTMKLVDFSSRNVREKKS